MTRRRLLVALGVALAVLVAVGAVWRLTRQEMHIDEAHCDRIRPGMRLDEVEAILGGPPGDYTVQAVPIPHFRGPGGPEPPKCWSSDQGQICVDFDEQGAVVQAW